MLGTLDTSAEGPAVVFTVGLQAWLFAAPGEAGELALRLMLGLNAPLTAGYVLVAVGLRREYRASLASLPPPPGGCRPIAWSHGVTHLSSFNISRAVPKP